MVEMVYHRKLSSVPKMTNTHRDFIACLQADDRTRLFRGQYDSNSDADLMLLCEARDLDGSGTRTDLINRLLEFNVRTNSLKEKSESTPPKVSNPKKKQKVRRKPKEADTVASSILHNDCFDSMTKAQLKDACSAQKISRTGNKTDLIHRLRKTRSVGTGDTFS